MKQESARNTLDQIAGVAALALHALETPEGRRNFASLRSSLHAIKALATSTPVAVPERGAGLDIVEVSPGVADELKALRGAVTELVRLHGVRLTRSEMLTRLRVSDKTLRERVRLGKYPAPGKDGKWLLTEIIEWEALR